MDVNRLEDMAAVMAAFSIFLREETEWSLKEMLKDNNHDLCDTGSTQLTASELQRIWESQIDYNREIPELLKQLMRRSITPISAEISEWLKHFNAKGIKDNSFILKRLYMTSYGRVDGKETAKRIIRSNESLTYYRRRIPVNFILAASYCLREVISVDQNLLDDISKFCASYRTNLAEGEYWMILNWCYFLLYEKNGKKQHNVEFASCSNYCEISRYFYFLKKQSSNHILEHLLYFLLPERDPNKRHVLGCLKNLAANDDRINVSYSFPTSHKTSFIISLFERIPIDEQVQIIRENPAIAYFLLSRLSEYPFKHLFLKYMQIAFKYVNPGKRIVLLREIARAMPYDTNIYERAFTFVLENCAYQKLIVSQMCESWELVYFLLVAERYDIVKTILNICHAKKKEAFISSWIRFLFRLKKNSTLVEKLLKQKNHDLQKKFMESHYGQGVLNVLARNRIDCPSSLIDVFNSLVKDDFSQDVRPIYQIKLSLKNEIHEKFSAFLEEFINES